MLIIPVKIKNNNPAVYNGFAIEGRPKTNLSSPMTGGTDSTASVFSIKGFSAGNYYALIGELGSGNAEIIKMHASTSPSGTTLTFASACANNHDSNEPVYFLAFNQWRFSNSATTTGAKSETGLGAKDIDPTSLWTLAGDATNTSGYAFAQPYNSDGASYPFGSGVYSAPAPYDNAEFNTAEYIINEAVSDLPGVEIKGELTYDKCIDWANECLRDIRKHKKKISWANSFNYIMGQMSAGVYRFSLPTDIYDKYSRRAIEGVRLGGEIDLNYVDPNYFFNVLMKDVHVTQVKTAASAGDTTLEVDNSYDFKDDSGGTIMVNGNDITYTGITRSATTGIFTGIPASGTGAITESISVDDWVWQGHTESKPFCYTLFNGYLYIWYLPDSTWQIANLYIDYFKTITAIDSLDDAVDYIQFDMLKNYLIWRIKAFIKNAGTLDLQDTNYLLYREQLGNHISKDGRLNKFFFRNSYEKHDDDYDDVRNPERTRKRLN